MEPDEYEWLVSSYVDNLEAHMDPYIESQFDWAKHRGGSHERAAYDAIIEYFYSVLVTHLKQATYGKRLKMINKLKEDVIRPDERLNGENLVSC